MDETNTDLNTSVLKEHAKGFSPEYSVLFHFKVSKYCTYYLPGKR